MRRIAKQQEEGGAEIDLTPMLDVVFIMLIFFIVVASFIKEAGIEVDSDQVSLEAMQAALKAHYLQKKMDVTEVFAEMDTDGSGYLDRAEIEKGVATLGLLIGPEDFESMMKEMDPDGDGEVTLQEFTGWWVVTFGTTKSLTDSICRKRSTTRAIPARDVFPNSLRSDAVKA